MEEGQADVCGFEIKSNKGPLWEGEQWNENDIWEREMNNPPIKKGVWQSRRAMRWVALAINQCGSDKSQGELEKLNKCEIST